MSRLSEHLQLVLDQLNLTARRLEQTANLPHMTVRGIIDGSHPRSERFDRLKSAIPSLDHRVALVIAYILDDCPASEIPAVESILRDSLLAWHKEHDPADTAALTPEVVQEAVKTYRPTPHTATTARHVLDRLRAAVDAGDSELSEWLATTGELLLSPHLKPE